MIRDESAGGIAMRDLPYSDGATRLAGALFRNEATAGGRPGLLLVHGGAGLDDHAREQARRYAALGYVVFACDMLGNGVAGDRARIIAQLTALRDDPALLARRARAGLAALAGCPGVDGRIAAIGFCFGGMAALALARSGERLAAVVSVHGTLATARTAEPGSVRARLLVCHGARDPHVPLADVSAFAKEMNGAGADWQLIMYGTAVHGFTHRHAAPGDMPGVAYDRLADDRSFAAISAFLAEAFAGQSGGCAGA
jgi:dienelactone hydrolase